MKTRNQLSKNLKINEFISKTYSDHKKSANIGINKAFAYNDYGFRVEVVKEGFVIVARKKILDSGIFSSTIVKLDRNIFN